MMKAHKIKRKANRVQRACYNCRKRKQGCDEERPCRRCIEKGIECVEVEPKRKRGRVRQPGHVCHSHSGSPSSDVSHSVFEGSTDYTSDSSKYDDSSDVELNPEMYYTQQEEIQFGRDESSPLPPNTVDYEDEEDDCDDEAEHSCLKDFNLAAVLPLIWNDLCAHPSASMDEMDLDSNSHSDNMDYPVGSPTFSSIDVWEASLDTEMKSDDYSVQVDNQPEEMMDCWRDLVRKIGSNENLRKQFGRMKETWREIINSLRTFDFPKVQSSLRELDPHDETSPPVVFWSSGGRIHHASSAFCRLVGYSADEISESQNSKIRAHSLFHPEETVKILSRQLDAVQQPMLTSYQLKTRLLGKNKQEIAVRCSISNLRDPVGTPLLTMAHFSLDL